MVREKPPSPKDILWDERKWLEVQREMQVLRLMKDYDEREYGPKLRDIQQRCKALGHTPGGSMHSNEVGNSFKYCVICKAHVYF